MVPTFAAHLQYAVSHFSVWRKHPSGPDLPAAGGIRQSGLEAPQTTADYYEATDILASYDRFHFGDGLLSVKNFPLRTAEVCIEACRKYRAGFGAGPRTVFEARCQVNLG
jgi:hypothetical protein